MGAVYPWLTSNVNQKAVNKLDHVVLIAGKKGKNNFWAVPKLGLVTGCGTVPEWQDQISWF